MSKHILLNTFITILLGLSFGYGITSLMQSSQTEDPNLGQRFVASFSSSQQPSGKLGVDQTSYDYLKIKIENESIAEKRTDRSVVRVKVTALKSITEPLKFKWLLGRDVLSAENLTGEIPALQAGESKEFSLNVQNYSKELQSHVSFLVSGQIGKHPVNRDVIVTSRPEDSFEYVVQQAEIQKQKNSGKGVHKLSNGRSFGDKFKSENMIK